MPTVRQTPKRQAQQERHTTVRAALWQPSPWLSVAILLLVIAVFAAVRFRLRDMPLERDEGKYAYAGQLMLEGVPPYQLPYNMKLPGTYAAYAAMMGALGQTPAGIHLGLLLANGLTIVLVYLLGARLFGRLTGLVAAASYGLLSTSPSVLGLAAHATHFVVLFAVAGLLLLVYYLDVDTAAWGFLLSGVLLGLAFLMKQPGIFFGLFAGLYLLWAEWQKKLPGKMRAIHLGILAMGLAAPYGLTCLIMWRAGVFARFWFWTFSYALHYGVGMEEGLTRLGPSVAHVVAPGALLWLLAFVGLTACVWDAVLRPRTTFVLGFLVFSFLAVCPGFAFSSHYFVLLLPAISLLVGVAVNSTTRMITERRQSAILRALPATFLVFALVFSICWQRGLFFRHDPLRTARVIYGENPFPEALQIGEFIRTHSAPTARIAVIGSEPEIYFYAQRHSATGYIYTYALMEAQPYARSMQDEMISEIEAARPEFAVVVPMATSWMASVDSDLHIFEWSQSYIDKNYERVGIADIQSDEHTEYRWEEACAGYKSGSTPVVYVFRRKGLTPRAQAE